MGSFDHIPAHPPLTAVSRDRVQRASETVQSPSVDLDKVAARLEEVTADPERLSRRPSPATTEPLLDEERYREDLQVETESYNALVDDGGRPSHPLGLLEDIVKNPGEYREILTFWQGKYPQEDEWRVFSSQLAGWDDFRRLQRFARGQSIYDYWRSVWEDGCKMRRMAAPKRPVLLAGRDMNGEDQWKRDWQRTKKDFGDRRVVYVRGQYRPWEQFVKSQGHQTEQQGFSEYIQALKERLARHGFTRTFQLDGDAARQDKLPTWIEYLGYEYWWYDRYTNFAKHRQQQHDEAWRKLIDSKVLKPEETEEDIWDDDSKYRDASESTRAENAVRSAMSAVSSAEKAISKSQRSRISLQELRQRLVAAQSMLEAAKKRHESVKRRNGFITAFIQQTKDYRIAKDDAEHHSILLRWMLQQVCLIELELNQPNVARNDSNQRNGRSKRRGPEEPNEEQRSQKQRHDESERRSISNREERTISTSQGAKKRKHSYDTIDNGRPSKRRKNIGRSPSLSNPSGLTTSTERRLDVTKATTRVANQTQEVKGSKAGGRPDIHETTTRMASKVRDSKVSLDQSSRICKPLRRSSRIAERKQPLLAAAAAPSANHPCRKIATSVMVPTISTTPEELKTRSSTTIAKRGRLRRSGLSNTSNPQGT